MYSGHVAQWELGNGAYTKPESSRRSRNESTDDEVSKAFFFF
jgi:hypothetical protein